MDGQNQEWVKRSSKDIEKDFHENINEIQRMCSSSAKLAESQIYESYPSSTTPSMEDCVQFDFPVDGMPSAIAQTEVMPGKLLLVDHNFIWVPDSKHALLTCHECMAKVSISDSMIECELCHHPVYCSKICKKAAQRLHDLECPLLAHAGDVLQGKSVDQTFVAAFIKARAQKKLYQEIDSCDHKADEKKKDIEACETKTGFDRAGKFEKLFYNDKYFSERWKADMLCTIEMLLEWDSASILTDEADSMSYAFRIKAHLQELEIMISQGVKISVFAVFPLVSCFQHSCSPNCYYWTNGATLEVRSVERISSGMPLTVSHIAVYAPRAERQAQLLETKHFLCQCKRCKDWECEEVIDGFICDGCEQYMIKGDIENGGIESKEAGESETSQSDTKESDICEYVQCPNCQVSNNYSDVLATKEEILPYTRMNQGVLLQNRDDQEQVTDLLALAEMILHPHHYLLYRSRQVMYQICLDANNIQDSLEHCKKIIDCLLSVVMPSHSVEAASYLVRLASLNLKLAAESSRQGDASALNQRDSYVSEALQALKDAKVHQDVCTGQGIIPAFDNITHRIQEIHPS